MTCKRVPRECKFCDRFWRLVIAYVVPATAFAALGLGFGAVAAFYWAGAQ